MTPDSPKGPESEAQIEIKRLEENEEFLERAVHLMLGCCDASDVPCEERDAEVLYEHVRNGTVPTTQRALSGLLRSMARRASSLRRQADRWHSRAEREFRDRIADTAKAMAESGQQRAEVSRLREQLATAVVLPEDWETRVRQLTHRWVARIAKAQKRNPNTIAERNGWVYNAENCADEIAGEVAVLVAGWVFASSFAAAPVSESVPATPTCASVSPGAEVPCAGRHSLNGKHESADGSLTWSEPGAAHAREATTPTNLLIWGGDHSLPLGRLLADCSCGESYYVTVGGDEFGKLEAAHEQHVAETLRASAPSEATPNPQITNEINTSASSPPSGGDSDTTPRVWAEGDIALDQTDFVHRRFESGWRTYPRDRGVQYSDADMEAGLGPLLRLPNIPAETDNIGHLSLLAAERVRASAAVSCTEQEEK